MLHVWKDCFTRKGKKKFWGTPNILSFHILFIESANMGDFYVILKIILKKPLFNLNQVIICPTWLTHRQTLYGIKIGLYRDKTVNARGILKKRQNFSFSALSAARHQKSEFCLILISRVLLDLTTNRKVQDVWKELLLQEKARKKNLKFRVCLYWSHERKKSHMMSWLSFWEHLKSAIFFLFFLSPSMASWPLFLVYISSLSLCDGIVYKFQCIWIKIHPKVAGSIFVTFGVIRQILLSSSSTNANTQIKKLPTRRSFWNFLRF